VIDELRDFFLGKEESTHASLGTLRLLGLLARGGWYVEATSTAKEIGLENYLSSVEDFELALAWHLLLESLSHFDRRLQ